MVELTSMDNLEQFVVEAQNMTVSICNGTPFELPVNEPRERLDNSRILFYSRTFEYWFQ